MKKVIKESANADKMADKIAANAKNKNILSPQKKLQDLLKNVREQSDKVKKLKKSHREECIELAKLIYGLNCNYFYKEGKNGEGNTSRLWQKR